MASKKPTTDVQISYKWPHASPRIATTVSPAAFPNLMWQMVLNPISMSSKFPDLWLTPWQLTATLSASYANYMQMFLKNAQTLTTTAMQAAGSNALTTAATLTATAPGNSAKWRIKAGTGRGRKR